MTLSGRIGCFFLIIGAGATAMFLASDVAKSPQFNYLLAGGILLFLGWRLWLKGKPPPRRSGRFRLLRHEEDEDLQDQQPTRR